MGQAESQWDSSLAEEYQRELNLRRTREQQAARENYQRLVNDYYYNRYIDTFRHTMPPPENFDEEKLLIEEDF